jgi:5-methylcytosine-specific restriction endonuclease McrA
MGGDAAYAASKRDPAVRREFQRLNPCPSTGKRSGACPGWQRDHVVPLCFYGADAVWNLQWLTVEEHKKKTKLDIKVCNWDGK